MSEKDGTGNPGVRFVEPPTNRKLVMPLLCPDCGARLSKTDMRAFEDATNSLPAVSMTFGCESNGCCAEIELRVNRDKIEIVRRSR